MEEKKLYIVVSDVCEEYGADFALVGVFDEYEMAKYILDKNSINGHGGHIVEAELNEEYGKHLEEIFMFKEYVPDKRLGEYRE